MMCAPLNVTICFTTAFSSILFVHGRYPQELFTLLEQHQVQWEYTAEELAIIAENTVDELGINLYYPHRVKAPSRAWHPETPFHPAGITSPSNCRDAE